MHPIIQNLEVKIYVYINFKRHKIKDHSNMFRIVCDPSSGSIKLYYSEIRSGSLMFVVWLLGVWRRNFEPVVCVYGTTGWELLVEEFSDRRAVHTHHWFKITLPNTD